MCLRHIAEVRTHFSVGLHRAVGCQGHSHPSFVLSEGVLQISISLHPGLLFIAIQIAGFLF